MKRKIITICLIGSFTSITLAAQGYSRSDKDLEHEIVVAFDRITLQWDSVALELGTYDGLSRYCKDRSYKADVISLLDDVHHYDTLLYKILTEKALVHSNREMRVTIREIEKVENKYKPKNFLLKLRDDCKGYKEIERNYKKIRNDLGQESYDGKAIVIDNDIHTYIRHITRLVDLIDKHIHHLLDQEE